jgi:hypothetical protein
MASSSSMDHQLATAGSSSEEGLLIEDSVDRRSVRFPRRRATAAVLGAIALVACVVVAFSGVRETSESEQHITLRNLLESPDVHNVAANNIIKVQRRMTGVSDDAADVHKVVSLHFGKITRSLQDSIPGFSQTLDTASIKKTHHDAVVHAMRYLSDSRLQSIGLDMAHAVRDAKTDDHDTLKSHIVAALAPRKAEMTAMQQEMFPAEVRKLYDEQNTNVGFEDMLQPQKLRVMRSFDNSWDARITSHDEDGEARKLSFLDQTTTKAPLATALDVIGILGAVAQEVSVILRMIKPLTKIMPADGSHDLGISPMATTIIGFIDALFNTISCELDAAQDDDNPIEMVTCPLMSGSAAFDMMRLPLTHMGLLGDNVDPNGTPRGQRDPTWTQGEHSGPVNVTAAELAAGDSVLCIPYGNCGDTTSTTTTTMDPAAAAAAAQAVAVAAAAAAAR